MVYDPKILYVANYKGVGKSEFMAFQSKEKTWMLYIKNA
jgi:hypothetical protein